MSYFWTGCGMIMVLLLLVANMGNYDQWRKLNAALLEMEHDFLQHLMEEHDMILLCDEEEGGEHESADELQLETS